MSEFEKLAFDMSDRLRKSLSVSGLGVQDMADYLGVSRVTVSRWVNGQREPKLSTLRLWAIKTGVPLEWLTTGSFSPAPAQTPARAWVMKRPHPILRRVQHREPVMA